MRLNSLIKICVISYFLISMVSAVQIEISPDVLYKEMPVFISYTDLQDEDWIDLGFQVSYNPVNFGYSGINETYIYLPFNLSGVWFVPVDGNISENNDDFFSETYDFSGMSEGFLFFDAGKNVTNIGEPTSVSYIIAGEKESGDSEGTIILYPSFEPFRGNLNITVYGDEGYVFGKDIPYYQDLSIPYAIVEDVTAESGSTNSGFLTFSELNTGLSLYNATITLDTPGIGRFSNAVLPAGFDGVPVISDNTIHVNATTSMVGPLNDFPVLNITYEGLVPGSTQVDMTIHQLKDSTGTNLPTYEEYPGLFTVTSPPLPKSGFTGTPTKGILPFNVSFQYISPDSPTSFNWSFGDGSPNATIRNPTHTYWKAGSFDVGLAITSPDGEVSSTKQNYIQSKQVPLWFMANITSGNVPKLISFNGTTGTPGSTSDWVYYFGDGTTGVGPNTTHQYTTAGTYTVRATALIGGAKNSAIRYNYVNLI